MRRNHKRLKKNLKSIHNNCKNKLMNKIKILCIYKILIKLAISKIKMH